MTVNYERVQRSVARREHLAKFQKNCPRKIREEIRRLSGANR